MNKLCLSILFFFTFYCAFCIAQDANIEVYFSPRGGCTAAIVKEITTAKASIEVQVYEFSSTPIAAALVDAKNRGVAVYVIVDRKNSTAFFSKSNWLQQQGIPTRADGAHTIMHDKTMIIDDTTVITGSFNFTDSAENSNSENVIIIKDQATAKKYLNNWIIHRDHSSSLPPVHTGPGRP